MGDLPAEPEPPMEIVKSRLEAIKHETQSGVDYWRAREMMKVFGYDNWANFEGVIHKARIACDEARQYASADHFLEANEMVGIGSGAMRGRGDWFLSRYASYLVAMNADPNKAQVAAAQSYFAHKTRERELDEADAKLRRRVHLRDRLKQGNKDLNAAAQAAGVRNFGKFHHKGFLGLYDMPLDQLRKHKGIGADENPMDRAEFEELAANAFRVSQTEGKLKREGIKGEDAASNAHFTVARKTRETIRELGGSMPENMTVAPPIREVQKYLADKDKKRLAKSKP